MVSTYTSKCHFFLDTYCFTGTAVLAKPANPHANQQLYIVLSLTLSFYPMARGRVKSNNGVGELGAEGVLHQIKHESLLEIVRYKECMHNHAASMGYYTIDGCCEFVKGGEDGTPESLLCAACECHRSFHRKEVLFHDGTTEVWYLPRPVTIVAAPIPLPHNIFLYNLRAPPLNQHQNEVPSEILREGETKVEMEGTKKPRTKLTKEQKERMSAFAERFGWKSHRHNDEEIRKFCSDIGISRRVFKVWLNNNRYGKGAALPAPSSSASPPPQQPSSPPPSMPPLPPTFCSS